MSLSNHFVMNPSTRPPHHHGRLTHWGGDRPATDYPSRPVLKWFHETGTEGQTDYIPSGWYMWTKGKGWVAATTLEGYRGSHGSTHTGAHRICAQCGQKDHPTTEGTHSLSEGCEVIIIDGRREMYAEPAHFCSAFCLHGFKTGTNPRFAKKGRRGASTV